MRDWFHQKPNPNNLEYLLIGAAAYLAGCRTDSTSPR
jgi:hypothetical protein